MVWRDKLYMYLLAVTLEVNPLLPKSDLQILCLVPDDFTRQREALALGA